LLGCLSLFIAAAGILLPGILGMDLDKLDEKQAFVENIEYVDHLVVDLLHMVSDHCILHGDHGGGFFVGKLEKRDLLFFFPVLVAGKKRGNLRFVIMQIILKCHVEMKKGLFGQDFKITDEIILFI
jgi:hypothetical protein